MNIDRTDDRANESGVRYNIMARVREFSIPPIQDGLVLGVDAPIGLAAIQKALNLLAANRYEVITLTDDVVSHVLVRQTLMRRLPREALVSFVLQRVKPLMGPEEILHLTLDAEVTLDGGAS